MPYYLFTARYTAASLRAMVDNPQDREAPARALAEGAGAKLHHIFFMFGQDDVMALLEAPDDTTMAATALAIGASGGFSGGATTKLMTAQEAMKAMEAAGKARAAYTPPTG
jgi:uncharacterized protein with GYD domain